MPSTKQPAKGLLGRLFSGRPANKGPKSGRKGEPSGKKKVWRISESKPNGEWVDADSAPTPLARDSVPGEVTTDGWLTSSMDLMRGSDIVEDPDSTAPAPLRDDAPTLPRTRNPFRK